MELEKFISESIKSIIKGIADSKDFAIEYGARVNPEMQPQNIKQEMMILYKGENGGKTLTKLDFDIAVTATNESTSGGSGSINVFAAKVGGKLEGLEKVENISRLKFTLNICLPYTKEKSIDSEV